MNRTTFYCLLLIITGTLLSPAHAYADRKGQHPVTIYGEVVSEQGIPVMGAIINIQESTAQTITDEFGNFTIDIPSLNSNLEVEADGFERFTTIVMTDGWLKITLRYSVEGQGIRDKVNMPWMTTDKRSLTSSVSTTTQAELRKSPTIRLNQALSGRLPGLKVVSGSAFPGDESGSWRIRGLRTLVNGGMNTMSKGGYGEPIVIVDGFERKFTDFDPSEIESFSILKDAAATAVYGSRAANGVILVTTKRGEQNHRTIDVEFTAGFVCPTNLPEFLTADQYATLHNEARINDGLKPLYSQEDIQLYKDGTDPLGHPNVDYYKEFIKPHTQQIKGSLSLSGGNRIVKYFIGLAFNNQGGLYKRTDDNPDFETKLRYSRYNARANVDLHVFKRLTASFNLAGRIEDRRYPYTTGADMFKMFSGYPSNAFPIEFQGIDPSLNKEIHMLGGNSLYTTNPLGELSYKGYREGTYRYYQLGVIFKHEMDYITNGLRLNFEFNADGYN